MSDEDDFILSGYDDMGYDDMGAAPRRRLPGRRRMPARRPAARLPAPRQAFGNPTAREAALDAYQPDARGLPLDQVMPFQEGTFTAAVTTLLLQGQPQRSFQMRRLVIDLGRFGATAAAPQVKVTQLTVGADPQFVSTGAIPARQFDPTAVGTLLKPAAARAGITIYLGLGINGALTAPDTITVVASATGPSIG